MEHGLCTFHSGAIDLARRHAREAVLGPQAGRAASDALEARAYAALDELLSSPSATARVAATKFALDRLTANSPAGLEAAKNALWLDLQEQKRGSCRRRGTSSPA